jgi:hypothetical protein
MDGKAENGFCPQDAIGAGQGRPKTQAPPIVFIGVQHTGTSFFTKILEAHYGPYTPLKSPRGRFYYDHPWPHKLPLIRSRMRGRLLVTTQRDKEATKASWIRRNTHELEDFHAQWDAWERFILPRAFVLSIERRESLAELSEVLGIELETDWKAVNAT